MSDDRIAVLVDYGCIDDEKWEVACELQTARAENEELRTALGELLHWIYPTEAHHEHRAEHFTDEARIGFKLIGEPNPFEDAAHETVLDSSHNQS
jgi:hypothetical protein